MRSSSISSLGQNLAVVAQLAQPSTKRADKAGRNGEGSIAANTALYVPPVPSPAGAPAAARAWAPAIPSAAPIAVVLRLDALGVTSDSLKVLTKSLFSSVYRKPAFSVSQSVISMSNLPNSAVELCVWSLLSSIVFPAAIGSAIAKAKLVP